MSLYANTQTPFALGASSGSLFSSCPTGGALSCHNSTAQDRCCFNYPGGLILQTQFWDTNPPTGPDDSWTLHGLWPDNCDGTYEANCDHNRVFRNITQILQGSGEEGQRTLDTMNTYWKDYQGDDENFWEHEWSKHGTCISTLDPQCFGDSPTAGTDGVLPYFSRAVSLFNDLPTHDWLAEAGIMPSNTARYTKAAILTALKDKTGQEPYLGCKSGALNEVWYFYNVQGSLATGNFEHAAIVGKTGTCGTSVLYLPKSSSRKPTKTGRNQPPAPTSTDAFSGRGFLTVDKGGCLISSGKWYKSGTCATYTATPSSAGANKFTLRSGKGNCASVKGIFVCASNVAAGYIFSADNNSLAYSTDSDIRGTMQGTVFTSEDHPVEINVSFLQQ